MHLVTLVKPPGRHGTWWQAIYTWTGQVHRAGCQPSEHRTGTQKAPLPGYLPWLPAWGTPGPMGGQEAHLLLFQGQLGARSAPGRRATDWGPSQAVEMPGNRSLEPLPAPMIPERDGRMEPGGMCKGGGTANVWPDLTWGTGPQETFPQPRPESVSSLVSELRAERKKCHLCPNYSQLQVWKRGLQGCGRDSPLRRKQVCSGVSVSIPTALASKGPITSRGPRLRFLL